MSHPHPAPAAPLPDDFMQMLRQWQESRIVLTALELDVFTAVSEGGTAAEIAALLRCDPRGAAILLDALAALGLLEKHGGRYTNGTIAARHLRAGAPHDWRAALMHNANLWRRWSGLTECVRRGRPAPPEEGGAGGIEVFIAAMHHNASARAPLLLAALDLKGVHRALDLGGGSGAYAIALARAVPGLTVEVVDAPDVVPLTARYAAEAGLADRVTARAGDLRRDDFGSGYDLALLSAVCHMFAPGENADLLRRAAAALAPGGRVLIQDFVLDSSRTAPRGAAIFSVNMLVNTESGSNYTRAEYFEWMRAAGLTALRSAELRNGLGLLEGRRL